MLGIMQDWPLTVDKIMEHARLQHAKREIITRRVGGEIVRTTYADVFLQSKQVSNALKSGGIGLGDRVATLGWNSARHMSTWYGAMGIGAVLHTINPRLHPNRLPGSQTTQKTRCSYSTPHSCRSLRRSKIICRPLKHL